MRALWARVGWARLGAGVAALAAATATVAVGGGAGAAPTFGTALVVSGDNAGEPGIDVAKDGTIYVNAPAGVGVASFVYRSIDGGASWVKTPPGNRSTSPGGGDSDIALDPVDGTVYMSDLWLGNMSVAVSHDRANTWTAQPVGGPPVQDRQWDATPGGGRAYLVTHQIPTGLVVSKSVDGGVTYPVHSVAATVSDQTGCICPPGTMVSESGGLLGDKVGVIYSTSTGGVKFARSTNGATSFSQSVVSPASSADTIKAFPIVADAGAGKLVAAWMEVAGSTSVVRFSSSANFGQTWAAPRTLVSSGTSLYPWIDGRGTKVAVSLYHTDATGTPDTVPESAAWVEQYLESTDGGATFGAPTTVDSTVVKTGPICTGGTNCSTDRELLDYQSVAIDTTGHSDLTWTRSIDGVSDTEIRFAHQTA